ncbi:MAG: hypothetical protein CMF07_04855 [Idiomarina sp.]|nr:hypothetical protein [Idiomarina sp.]
MRPITFYFPSATRSETAKPATNRKTLMPVILACGTQMAAPAENPTKSKKPSTHNASRNRRIFSEHCERKMRPS